MREGCVQETGDRKVQQSQSNGRMEQAKKRHEPSSRRPRHHMPGHHEAVPNQAEQSQENEGKAEPTTTNFERVVKFL